MNYKIIVIVLVGILGVGGAMYLSSSKGERSAMDNGSAAVEQDSSAEKVTNTVSPTAPSAPKAASNNSVDDVLSGFSGDVSAEQGAFTDDLDSEAFAQGELSGFESESYDF